MSVSPEVEVRDNPADFRYEAHSGGRLAAYTRYEVEEDVLTATHTETLPGFAGQGMGGRLASGLLDDLRRRGMSVDPQCRFIRTFINRHPQYLDLVPPALRTGYEM